MKYTATAVVRLASGSIVGLVSAQAHPRRHALRAVPGRDGWYEAIQPIELKAGEVFQYEGDLPKVMASSLALPDGTPAAAVAMAADGKAKAKVKSTPGRDSVA